MRGVQGNREGVDAMNTFDATSYATNRHLPDLRDRGCTIATSYGEFAIEPGREAALIARAVARILFERRRIEERHARAEGSETWEGRAAP